MQAGSYLLSTSTLLTYVIRFAGAYMLVCALCFSLRKSRLVRLWLWRALLSAGLIFWLFSIIPHNASAYVTESFTAAQGSATPSLTWSLPVPESLTSRSALLQSWLLQTYIAVALFLVVSWGMQIFLLRRLFYDTEDPPDRIRKLFRKLCLEQQVSSCRLRLSSTMASPCTAGWRRPYIVLPSELARRIGSGELAHILRHELVHVRRRDYLWDRLASFACRIIWFHPVAWLLARHMRKDREFACDQAVTKNSADRSLEYADCLVHMARLQFSVTSSPSGVIDFASSPSFLSERIHALLEVPPVATFSNQVVSACFAVTTFCSLLTVVPRLGVTFLSDLTLNLIAPARISSAPLTGAGSTVRTTRRKMARRLFVPNPTESQQETATETRSSGEYASHVASVEELPAAPMPTISSEPQKSVWDTHSRTALLFRTYSTRQTKLPWQQPPPGDYRVHLGGWRRAAVTAAAVAGSVLAQSLSDSPDSQQPAQHEQSSAHSQGEHR